MMPFALIFIGFVIISTVDDLTKSTEHLICGYTTGAILLVTGILMMIDMP